MQTIINSIKKELIRRQVVSDAEGLEVQYFPPAQFDADIAFRLRSSDTGNAVLAKRIDLEGLPFVQRANLVNGYINLRFDIARVAAAILPIVSSEEDLYGFPQHLAGKQFAVEHTSLNPVYPVNISTFRGTVLGDAVQRLLAQHGASVRTHFWVADTCRQLRLVAAGMQALGLGLDALDDQYGKPDHTIGRIFALSLSAIRGEDPEKAMHKAEQMFPLSAFSTQVNIVLPPTISLASGLTGHSEETQSLVMRCLDGFQQTLQGCGVKVDDFNFESEFLRDPEVSKNLDMVRETLYITGTNYFVRNIAYFLWLLRGPDIHVMSVMPQLQKVIGESSLRLISQLFPASVSQRLQIIFFGDVRVKPHGPDSVFTGHYNSVDTLSTRGKLKPSLNPSNLSACVKLHLLGTSNSRQCTLDLEAAQEQLLVLRILNMLRSLDELLAGGPPSTGYTEDFVEVSATERLLLKVVALYPLAVGATLSTFEFKHLTNHLGDLIRETSRYLSQCSQQHREPQKVLLQTIRIVIHNTLRVLGIKPL